MKAKKLLFASLLAAVAVTATGCNGQTDSKQGITEDTILACEYAFQLPDVTGGAIYFESKDSNVHAAYAEFMFQDDIGHKFYK